MRQMKDSGFEWIDQIPQHWKVYNGKYVLNLKRRPVEEKSEIITCFRDGQVTLRKNRREEGFTFSEKEIGYQGIECDDLVIHGMDGFAGAIGISDSKGKGSPVLIVCTAKENINIRFAMYYLRMLASRKVFLALATGIRERSCDLRWKKIATLKFIIPPLDEQNKIAAYLDRKCTMIDELITKNRRLIELLKIYKKSMITEAVTKGLDRNVAMKDSGVEWIGEIPEHWILNRIKRVCNIIMGQSPSSYDIFDTGKTPFMQGNKEFGKVHPKTTLFCEKCSKKSRIGDLLLSVRAPVGKINISDKIYGIGRGLCSIKAVDINFDFLRYYMMKSEKDLLYYSRGSLFEAITLGDLKNFPIVMPPIEEQKKIAAHLDKNCAILDKEISIRQQLVEKFTQYKKSLIYEVVTGKLEV